MPAVPTSNILQPGAIAVTGGANRALISSLQLLTPQYYKTYVETYGSEAFFMWLATYAGMEEVKNDTFFWFENRGKLMLAVTNLNAVTGPAAGATVTLSISAADYYTSTSNALRVGETVRVASNNIEGEILTIDTTTPSAWTFTVRPKLAAQAFVSAGSANLLAGEVLIFGGQMDVGEASTSAVPQVHLDIQKNGSTTQMRETWEATDLAEMTEVYYNTGVSGSEMAGGTQAGTSYFTYKGLVKANQRFLNNVENKLMRGNLQDNTGLTTTTSTGTLGFIPSVQLWGESVTYTPGTLDIAKLHEITRLMDVNGCAKDNLWLMDINQRQNFSDGLFAAYPAGAWVWGSNEKSEEASIAYGVQSIMLDEYRFGAKKYKQFNTEVTVGKTPTVDAFRDYGIICPMGQSTDARDSTKSYKNVTIMYRQPPKGGTLGNGIRVWEHGGGSLNPTNGTMNDFVEMITYRGVRVVAGNQFIQVTHS